MLRTNAECVMTLVQKRYRQTRAQNTIYKVKPFRCQRCSWFFHIPDVRIIFEKLYLMTNEGFCKFAIIDGIHMLSGEANWRSMILLWKSGWLRSKWLIAWTSVIPKKSNRGFVWFWFLRDPPVTHFYQMMINMLSSTSLTCRHCLQMSKQKLYGSAIFANEE